MTNKQAGSTKSLISVLIPVFNERQNVPLMHEALVGIWKNLPEYAREIIFIDDGSTDETWQKITAVSEKDNTVKGIRFTRNFGKEAAIEAGLKKASGEAVIVMDGDLQHPTELIPEMIKAWKSENDIVHAKRTATDKESFLKKKCSSLFYRLLNIVSDTSLQSGSSDFYLLSRKAIDKVNSLTEREKFHRVLIHWIGYRSTSIPYKARERINGTSSYTLNRLFLLARKAIISSSTLPMTIIFFFGCLLVVLGVVLTGGLLFYKYFIDWEYIGAAAVLASFIILNNGILMIVFGIMSFYQVAVYHEVQNRPSYIIEDVV